MNIDSASGRLGHCRSAGTRNGPEAEFAACEDARLRRLLLLYGQGARRNGRRSWFGKRDWRWLGAQAHQMADREHEIGAVHGVEVQLLHAMVDEVDHLFGADGSRDQPARRGVVLEPLEPVGEPLRHACPRSPGEIGGLLEVLHWKDARHDWNVEPGGCGNVEKAEIGRVVEKETG